MKWAILFSIFLLLSACSIYRAPKTPALGKYPAFTEKDSLLGFLNEYRSNFDVTYYELDLKIEPDKKMISGSVKIHFTAIKTVKIMQIDLDPRLTITSIKDNNNQELAYTRKETAVLIDMKNEIRPAGESMIIVSYGGKPKVAPKPPWRGGLIWDKKNGSHFCGVSCEDDGSSIWWPSKDHISDKPDSAQMRFTVPNGYMCISNGRLIEHHKTFEGLEKFTWRTSYPINHYNITFYLGKYKHFTLPYENENSKLRDLDFYVREENEYIAQTHFKQAVEILEVYEDLFGMYPWWKDGYKLIESPYEGMEHQTAIAYGDEFENGKYLNYDYIILHETAHEWWGNYVTACDMSDLWLHEGFATYAEMLYEERTEGSLTYDNSFLLNKMVANNKLPLQGPRDVFYKNFKDNDIYSKGAVVLYMLRKTIGNDTKFFSIIKRFATENKECVYTEDFIDLVNEVAGADYRWFFDQYVYRREAPEILFWYGTLDNGESEFRYKWNSKNTNADFVLSVDVDVNDETITLFPSHEVQKLEITGEAPSVVYIDQYNYMIITEDKKL